MQQVPLGQWTWVAGWAVLLVSAGGCAVNPVSGRPEVAVVSAQKERELGAAEARKVEAEMGLVADPALLGYVQAVGARVVKVSPRQEIDYTFQIVNDPAPNAFALPNGNIYVSRGLLALANAEDELAAVLAHEVVHIAARHTVRSANVAVATSPLRIATGIAGLATGLIAPRLGEGLAGIGEIASEAVLAPYGRGQEREADDLGIELAARAGYDPAAMSRILAVMERDAALRRDGPPRRSFFDTHPATPERAQETRARATALRPAPTPSITATPREFLARLDGLLLGDDPADGSFLGSRFLQPTLGITLEFPAGWPAQNTRHAVAASAPDKQTLLLLTVAGKGDDPLPAARAFERAVGASVLQAAHHLHVNGSPAVRSVMTGEGEHGPTTLDLTWLAHGGLVYRLVGACPTPPYAAIRRLFDRTLDSFRGMTAADAARLREARLRVAIAREGETPADVARRTGSVWSAEELAIANGLPAGARLLGGQAMKVAISQGYRAREPKGADDPDARTDAPRTP